MSQCPFKQIIQATQCFLEGEQRLPLTGFLLLKRFSRFLGFGWKKTQPLLSEQIFFLNSSYVTKFMGNVSKSQTREESNWMDSGECWSVIITQNYCDTHLWTHTHVHPPASVKGRRFILAVNRDTSVTLSFQAASQLVTAVKKTLIYMTTCRSHGRCGNVGQQPRNLHLIYFLIIIRCYGV